MLTEFSELPLRRQEARRSWVSSRAQHLRKLATERKAKLTNGVARQLSALPRPVLHRAAAAANGGGGGLLGSPLSSSSSSSSSFCPIPDKKHLIELRERLDNTVGLGVVKAWIDSTIEDALRFCMAGERLPLRHILLSGRLGSGRRTVSYLPEGPP